MSNVSDNNGDLISAYLDRELSVEEQAKVEQLLADDPAAQRLADALTEVTDACRELPRGTFSSGLAERVLADAQRRISEGADKPAVAQTTTNQTELLEPGGEFGLPFGHSSRSWAWAGVAAAAAVLIGFYGRPEPAPRNQVAVVQPNQQAQWQQVALERFRQAAPQTRLVTIKTSPEGLLALQQKFQQQGIQLGSSAPMLAQRLLDGTGLVVSKKALNKSGRDQLMLVSAPLQRIGGLVNDLQEEGEVFQVEADPELATEQSTSIEQPQPSVALPLQGS